MMTSARVAVAMLASCLAGAGAARAELTLERIGQYLPLARATDPTEPIFTFHDIAAFQRSARYLAPVPAGAPAGADQRRWQGFAGAPVQLAPHPQSAQGLREATGVDSTGLVRILGFTSLRGVDISEGRDWVLVLSGAQKMASAEALDAALGRRDFVRADESGWTVWHRFPDYQLNVRLREPADPFDLGLGRSSRIAVRGADLVGTAAWAPLRAALAAIDGRAPSLSGAAEFVAALQGVADDAARRLDAAAIRAAGLHVGQSGGLALDAAALLRGTVEQTRAALRDHTRQATGEWLPPYVFAVLAEVSAGARESAVIALSYDAEAAAQRAAALLARRLAASAAGLQVDSRAVALPNGPAAWAAVAVATYTVDPAVPPVLTGWLDAWGGSELALIALAPR